MESTPKIFTTADEITLVKELGAPLQLTASGYLYEIDVRNNNAWFWVGHEDKVRPGQGAPLHTVNVGNYGIKAIAHFTSQTEAEKLVNSITSRLREGRLTSKIRPRLFSALELCAGALVVGLLGSMAAKVGWSLDLPFMSNHSQELHSAVQDRQASEYQIAIAKTMTAASESVLEQLEERAAKRAVIKAPGNDPLASPDNQVDAPAEAVEGK